VIADDSGGTAGMGSMPNERGATRDEIEGSSTRLGSGVIKKIVASNAGAGAVKY
jgi:hypothetical protein